MTQSLKPEEVASVIQAQLKSFTQPLTLESEGTILQIGDGIARIYGLQEAMMGELLEFPPLPNGEAAFGLVLNLEEDNVAAALLSASEHIKEGDSVKRTGRVAEVPVGPALLGRVVNSVGQPLDGKGPIPFEETRPVERIAAGVTKRQPVKEPLQTGLKSIDSMIPIGRGQRELVIGDRQTGKTALLVDTIINQKHADPPVKCIYVAIGQKQSTVANVIDTLEKHGAMEYTTIVSATASDPAPMQFIAPYAGCAIGEYFAENGQHAAIFYDDLSKHAVSYRELSLLIRRPPGREAYPGDVFYLHSRLLERALKYSNELGGGSLTAMPVIETQAGDVSAYIPTNVISITDGQIYLESDLFYAGIRPAINVGLSVSRVGGKAQESMMKSVAGRLRIDLAQYRELASFAQFGSDLDKGTLARLTRGERLTEVLKQPQYVPMPVEDQVAIIFAAVRGYLDDVDLENIYKFESEFLPWLKSKYPQILHTLKTTRKLDDDTDDKLDKAVGEFKKLFVEGKAAIQPSEKEQMADLGSTG
ncbi:MAG: F0F1 ATP synthase subunit alpha [bacterium]|nr:F0F1 ATP synthase subunit alpha [bacterium]